MQCAICQARVSANKQDMGEPDCGRIVLCVLNTRCLRLLGMNSSVPGYCSVAGSSSSPVTGSASGAFVFTKVTTGEVTSFDPATGQGDVSINEYLGGKCDGAHFNHRRAVLIATGTGHVVLPDGGKRLDCLVTSYIRALGKIGGMIWR